MLAIVLLGFFWQGFSFLSELVSPTHTIKTNDFVVNLKDNGHFDIVSKKTGWDFGGRTPSTINAIATMSGTDTIGNYTEFNFSFHLTTNRKATIRVYQQKPVVLFDLVYVDASTNTGIFPQFTAYPKNSHQLTYQGSFAQAQFNLNSEQSPWVFFDDAYHTAVLSPASHFMIAATHKDAFGVIISGIDQRITELPKDYDQKTMLVIDSGVNQTLNTWGNALTDLQGKVRPANDSDLTLNTLGYWTDNGAAYYYHFDPKLGNYPATLVAIKQEYQQKEVPIQYMQLDSWWYGPKDKDQGILLYQADPSIWKDSATGKVGSDALKLFQNQLRLPTLEHARWIGVNSPYFHMYQMSKGVSIDQKWWLNRMAYLKNTIHSVLFEQDWLYQQAQTDFNLTDPEKFMDEMANATAANNLVMQYCLALPQHFLQGSQYNNLSSIRVSSDVFEQRKWEGALWTSKYATSLGIWPWVDVFKSRDQNNLLLADLSAGIVGPGDELGSVNEQNLQKVVRADSVIVKPDFPLVPIDQMYLQQANGQTKTAFIASTFTDFGNVEAYYLTAFSRPFNSDESFEFKPSDLGANGNVYVYDVFHQTGLVQPSSQVFTAMSAKNTLSYFVIVPVSKQGVAFLGDQGKFVSLGKKRISELQIGDTVQTKILFSIGESSIMLFGSANHLPVITAALGVAEKPIYNPETQFFTVQVHPGKNLTAQITID